MKKDVVERDILFFLRSVLSASGCRGPHSLQLSQRIERAQPDQLETHEMRLTQRKLFQHFSRRIQFGLVENESHADPVLQRIPLINLTGQIESDGLPDFGRQDGALPSDQCLD